MKRGFEHYFFLTKFYITLYGEQWWPLVGLLPLKLPDCYNPSRSSTQLTSASQSQVTANCCSLLQSLSRVITTIRNVSDFSENLLENFSGKYIYSITFIMFSISGVVYKYGLRMQVFIVRHPSLSCEFVSSEKE